MSCRAVFDFLVHVWITEGNGVARIVLPLDNFEELGFEIIHQTHNNLPFLVGGIIVSKSNSVKYKFWRNM